MGYKYYPLQPLTSASQTFINEFQQNLNYQFDIASDVFTIKDEYTLGSGSYIDTKVRINHAVSSETGEKLGDDFKKLMFKDLSYAVSLGHKYYFDTNYWVTIFTEKIKNLAASSVVRRCNNVLRWSDPQGNLYEEPCAIEYQIKRPSDSVGAVNPVTPEGFTSLYCQLNSKTKYIKDNQRFLFGNTNQWTAYKVYGNGTRNFLNSLTEDNDSCQILLLYLGVVDVNNDTDDVVNGIADRYKAIYSISASPTSIIGNIGNSYQITSYVSLNGIPSSGSILYDSSDDVVATVSGCGLVTLNSSGSANILLSISGNNSASAVISVTSSSSLVMPYEIRVDPSSGLVLEGSLATFEVYGYVGGVQQGDSFVFSVANNYVPSDHYILSTVDGNHFSVTNSEMYLNYPLTITATSGSHSKDIDIYLRGAW